MPRPATVMRKRRNGIWHAQGQGSGYTSPGIKDDAADDADGDDDDDLSPEDRLKKANDEAKRRRLQVKELRRENERLKAERAENGGGNAGPEASEVILALVEAGMSKDRIRAAMKLVDWSSVDDVEDAIDELRDEHPFLFDAPQPEQDLPGTGSRHNGMKQKGGTANNQQLINKYPALRYAQGRS